jgi:hypothetical protein
VPLLVVLVVASTTLGVMVVLAVSLFRHLKLLSASVGAFRDQVQPVLEDITAGAAAAQERLDRMSRREAMRKR